VLVRTRTEEDVDSELNDIQDVVQKKARLRDLMGGRIRPLLAIGLALALRQPGHPAWHQG
jgi:hypothetical protein